MQGEFKRLEATKWPYPENFATHGDFYAIVVSHANKLIARGHPQDLIAESLDNFLMSSKKEPNSFVGQNRIMYKVNLNSPVYFNFYRIFLNKEGQI